MAQPINPNTFFENIHLTNQSSLTHLLDFDGEHSDLSNVLKTSFYYTDTEFIQETLLPCALGVIGLDTGTEYKLNYLTSCLCSEESHSVYCVHCCQLYLSVYLNLWYYYLSIMQCTLQYIYIYIYIYIVLSFFLYYVHSLLFVLFVYDMYIVVDSLS